MEKHGRRLLLSHPQNSESFLVLRTLGRYGGFSSMGFQEIKQQLQVPPPPCCVSTTLDLRPPPTSAHCPLGSTFEPPPLRPFVKKRRRRSTRGAVAAAVQCPILAVGREKEEGREGRRLDDGAQGALFFAAPTAEYLCIWRREERGRREGGRVIIFQETQKGKELLFLFFHI